jgi:hypothetical protein
VNHRSASIPSTSLLVQGRKTISTKQTAARDADETTQNRAQTEQFVFDVDAPGLIDVTNELMVRTCPHHVHRNAYCNHMAAVENAIDDGTLEAFLSEDDNDAEPNNCDCEDLGGFPC